MNRYEVRIRSRANSDVRSMIEVTASDHNDAKRKAEALRPDFIVIYVNLIAISAWTADELAAIDAVSTTLAPR